MNLNNREELLLIGFILLIIIAKINFENFNVKKQNQN